MRVVLLPFYSCIDYFFMKKKNYKKILEYSSFFSVLSCLMHLLKNTKGAVW